MKQKHFMDIERLKEKFEEGFRVGDHIVIQEKIDGSCFSIRYDEETGTVAAFSRKNPLDFKNSFNISFNTSVIFMSFAAQYIFSRFLSLSVT